MDLSPVKFGFIACLTFVTGQQQHPVSAGEGLHRLQQEGLPRGTGLLQEGTEDQPQLPRLRQARSGTLLRQTQPSGEGKVRAHRNMTFRAHLSLIFLGYWSHSDYILPFASSIVVILATCIYNLL